MKRINFIILFFASALIILSACNKEVYSDYSILSAKQKQALIFKINADPIYQKDIAALELWQEEGMLKKVDFSHYNASVFMESVQSKTLAEAYKDADAVVTPEYINAMETEPQLFRELLIKYPAISKFNKAEMKQFTDDELTKNFQKNIQPHLGEVYKKDTSIK